MLGVPLSGLAVVARLILLRYRGYFAPCPILADRANVIVPLGGYR